MVPRSSIALYNVFISSKVKINMDTSVVLVRSLHFSYGLVTVCKVRLHNSYSFG